MLGNITPCFLLLLGLPLAQPQDLGWTGSPLFVDSGFVSPAGWQTGNSPGETARVSADSGYIQCHWTHGTGTRGKYSQCYYPLPRAAALGGRDVIGLELRGTAGRRHRHVMFKLENGSRQAAWTYDHLGGLARWSGRLILDRTQFSAPADFNWDSITVVSIEVNARKEDNAAAGADSGTLSLRELTADSATDWRRAADFEPLAGEPGLDPLKDSIASGILARVDSATGSCLTWEQDTSAWLYGQGLCAMILTRAGEWKSGRPRNAYARAAERVALGLVSRQRPQGHWPRAWNARTGAIRVEAEDDGSVWLGDFPWIGVALRYYAAKSGDARMPAALAKSDSLLRSLIDPATGAVSRFFPGSSKKDSLTSFEAYAAVALGLFSMGEADLAKRVLQFVKAHGWEAAQKRFKEGPAFSRPVLFTQTWLALLFRHIGERRMALDALSFAGKALYTGAAGLPGGLDGLAGPYSPWVEGSMNYISAGGPGSRFLFAGIRKLRRGDGTFPAYVDSLGDVGGAWSVDWKSLDATSWAYFAAAGTSPFHLVLLAPPRPVGVALAVDQPLNPGLAWHPVPGVDAYELAVSEDSTFALGTRSYQVSGDTAYALSGLASDKRYFWKVRSVGDWGAGDFAPVQKLVTRTAPFAKLLYTSSDLSGHLGFAECDPGGGTGCGCDTSNVKIESLAGHGSVTANPNDLNQWVNGIGYRKFTGTLPDDSRVRPGQYRYKALVKLPEIPRADTANPRIPEAVHLMIQYYDGRVPPTDKVSWDPAIFWKLNPWDSAYGQIMVYQNRDDSTLIPVPTGVFLEPDTLWHQFVLTLDFGKRKYLSMAIDGWTVRLDTFSIAGKPRKDWGMDVSLAITTESQSAFPQSRCRHRFSWATLFKDLEFGFHQAAPDPPTVAFPGTSLPGPKWIRPGVLAFHLEEPGWVRVQVLDARGRVGKVLFQGMGEKGENRVAAGRIGFGRGAYWVELQRKGSKRNWVNRLE